MTRRVGLVAITAFALAAALLGARVALAINPTSQLLTFRDHHDDGLTFTIEADPTAAQAGMFAMRVPGRGVYLSRAAATLHTASPTSTLVRYHGDADLVVTSGGRVARTTVPVDLDAQLDPAHHTAQITLTSGPDRFHVVQPAAGNDGALRVLGAFETALAANDWRSLYALTTTDITGALSADAFVAQASSQQATIGRTTAVDRLGVGAVQTNPAGLRFFVATYAVTQQRPDGTSATTTYDAYFVLQGEAWKLWFTARR